MMPKYSIIIPVYNRPLEVDELLESLALQEYKDFEVLVVEDGSTSRCKSEMEKYRSSLDIRYFLKENSGPGPSRNVGAGHSKGEWLIFMDSDCTAPAGFLKCINDFLLKNPTDAFGGPDREKDSFNRIQKAISYAMTSVLTTGGIRGGKRSLEKFKPRSFNMGIRKEAFKKIGGFRTLRFGEDMDLSLQMAKEGFRIRLIGDAYVFHKRRTSFKRFYKQVFNSGIARILLSELHPRSLNIVHLLPFGFVLGHLILVLGGIVWPQLLFFLAPFPVLIFIDASIRFKSMRIGVHAIVASYIQLFSYGTGFIHAVWERYILRKPVKHKYLERFYS